MFYPLQQFTEIGVMDSVEEDIRVIKESDELPSPPASPRAPELPGALSTKQKMAAIQRFIESFQYNYSGKPFVNLKKSRGMSHIYGSAKEIVRAGLPIQCVEATFLATLLTANQSLIDRVPMSFKSKFEGKVYRHIVLAVRENGRWGALGISRRSNLMNKPMRYTSLAELAMDYRQSYKDCFHTLLNVYMGLPFSHETYTDAPIKWRARKIRMNNMAEAKDALNKFCQEMSYLKEYFEREGKMPAKAGKSLNTSNKSGTPGKPSKTIA